MTVPALDLEQLAGADVDELRAAITATRSVLKSHLRSCRTALQFVSDLADKLEAASPAEPKEAQRNGNHRDTRSRRHRAG